jgi:hypothetical protein
MVVRLFPDLPAPDEPLTETEKHVFGFDAKRHPLCGFVVEQSVGSHPVELQAELFCQNLERSHGPEAASAMSRRLAIAKK